MPVLPFDDDDEAVARANASPFGLAGSIWTADVAAGAALAARLETGMAWVRHACLGGIIRPSWIVRTRVVSFGARGGGREGKHH